MGRPDFLSAAAELLGERLDRDPARREQAARDRSIYRRLPSAVATPRDEEELCRLVSLAAEYDYPLALRGGGSGTGGAALSDGLVILLSGEQWEREPEILEEGAAVRVRPGLSYAKLSRRLAPLGVTIPADPSSASISTLGGNIATRASGPHAFRYGSMDRYLREVTFVDGVGAHCTSRDRPSGGRAAALTRLRGSLSSALLERIRSRESVKCASGPRLLPFLEDPTAPRTVSSLLCGSLGAFGIVTEAVLETRPLPPGRKVVLYTATSDREAVDLTEALRGPATVAIELIDTLALRIAKRAGTGELPLSREQRTALLAPQAHLLIHETSEPDSSPIEQGQRPLQEKEEGQLWRFRKGMLWQMGRLSDRFSSLSVINDLAVPKERLLELITLVRSAAADLDLALPFYGHAGDANLHFRPLFRLDHPRLREQVRYLAETVYPGVTALGGTITGEHGLGPLRAPFLASEWGQEGLDLFWELKTLFDPRGVLNPGALLPAADLLDHFSPGSL